MKPVFKHLLRGIALLLSSGLSEFLIRKQEARAKKLDDALEVDLTAGSVGSEGKTTVKKKVKSAKNG